MSDLKSERQETLTGASSRRGFLKWMSQVAGTLAATLGGALAASAAQPGSSGILCCYYRNGAGGLFAKCSNEKRGCPAYFHRYPLAGIGQAPQCRQC